MQEVTPFSFPIVTKMDYAILLVLVALSVCWADLRYHGAVSEFEKSSSYHAEQLAKKAAALWDGREIAITENELVRGGKTDFAASISAGLRKISQSLTPMISANLVQAWFSSPAAHQRAIAFGLSGKDAFVGIELPWTKEAIKSIRSGDTTSTRPYEDQRNEWVTAYAPLRSNGGRVVGTLQVDYPLDKELSKARGSFISAWATPLVLVIISSVLFLLFPAIRIPEQVTSFLAKTTQSTKSQPQQRLWEPKLDVFYNQLLYLTLLQSKLANKRIVAESFSGGSLTVDGTMLKPVFKSLGSVVTALIDKDIESEQTRRYRGKRSSASIKFDAQAITDTVNRSQWLWLGISTDGQGVDLSKCPGWEGLKKAVATFGGTVDAGNYAGKGTWITLVVPRVR